MRPTHLVSVRDFSGDQIRSLFQEAARLKKNRRLAQKRLAGKTLGLLFQKPSLRTRVSFEVGMAQLGGQSIYIGPVELEGGKREGAKDLARVLSRYLDGIVTRTFSHEEVEQLAKESEIPVINGLSNLNHPCQALSDLFTVWEKCHHLKGVKLAFIGDGNNVCHALLEACALTGVHLAVATPPGYKPDPDLVRFAKSQGRRSGSQIFLTDNPQEAVRGVHGVYTDVWTSMGQEQESSRRRKVFRRFQVSEALMKKASPGAFFMHCLPAHRGEEVTDEVMDSRCSIVYDQAENRLHVQKAILLRLMTK